MLNVVRNQIRAGVIFFLILVGGAAVASARGAAASSAGEPPKEQSPTTADQPIEILEIAAYRNATPLVKKRKWVLKNGVQLHGEAVSSLMEGWVKIANWRAEGHPKEVAVALEEFSDADRKQLQARIKRPFNMVRYPYLPRIADSIENWNGTPPAGGGRFPPVVAVDRGKVFGIQRNRLFAVEQSEVAAEELADLQKKFAELGNGDYLTVNQWVPAPIYGKVISETADSFVLEVGPHGEKRGFGLPAGSRYRLPKERMGFVLTKELRAILGRYENLDRSVELSEAAVQELPVARLGLLDWKFCFPADEPNQQKLEVFLRSGNRSEISHLDIGCADLLAHEKEVLRRSGTVEHEKLHDAALLRVADSASKRTLWMLGPSDSGLHGTLLGALGDGFVFRDGKTGDVFVPAADLSDVDRQVAEIATRDDTLEWLGSVDLPALMNQRVLISLGGRSASFAKVTGTREVDAAIQGAVPVAQYLHDSQERQASLTSPPVRSLLALATAPEASRRMAALQQRFPGDALRKQLLAKRSPHSADLPDLAEHPANIVIEEWAIADGSQTIKAGLAGSYGDDLVFQGEFKGEKKFFLLAATGLANKERARAKKLLSRLPRQDWSEKLAMAENYQYFRLWMSPSNQHLQFGDDPVVVTEIGSQLMRFEEIDGTTFTKYILAGQPEPPLMPQYRAALAKGVERLHKAESVLPEWTFRDSTAKLYAAVIGDAEDDVLMRNLREEEFLLFKGNLDDSSLEQLAAHLDKLDEQTRIDTEAAASLPRMWCARTELVGPGTVRQVRLDSDREFSYRDLKGESNELPLAALTQRQRLVTEARWLRQTQDLPDDRSIDERLSQELPAGEVLTAVPQLNASLKQRIENALSRRPVDWESSPLGIDPKTTVVAIDAEAAAGLTQLANEQWQRVDLVTGKTGRPIRFQKTNFGPWLHRGHEKVWWVSDGKLMVDDGTQSRTIPLPETEGEIIAADQAGDFNSILLMLPDRSIYRLDLETGEVVCLQEPSQRSPSDKPAALYASPDGSSVLKFYAQSMWMMGGSDEAGRFVAGGGISIDDYEPRIAAAGNRTAVFSNQDDVQVTRIWNVRGTRPSIFNLPLVPEWLDYVQTEHGEVLQMIGRPADAFFADTGYFFVGWTDPAGSRDYHNQVIYGEVGPESLMAANGAALLHQRDGQYVVSRRPAGSLSSAEDELAAISRDLVNDLDVGQLEAVSHYLEQSPRSSAGEYPGAVADAFHQSINQAILDFQPHLGGDRLERSRRLAECLLRKFRNSQVARCGLTNWHITVAWDARGTGYAGTVSERGWEQFRDHMAKAETTLKPLLQSKRPGSQAYHQAIAIAMANGKDLDELRKLAIGIRESPYAENPMLHKSMAIFLLPRWHGAPGMTEAYLENVAKSIGGDRGDAMYVKAISAMRGMGGNNGPVTYDLQWNQSRLVAGTKAYYDEHRDTQVVDHMLLLLANSGQVPPFAELVRFCKENKLLAASLATSDLSGLRQKAAEGKKEGRKSHDRI